MSSPKTRKVCVSASISLSLLEKIELYAKSNGISVSKAINTLCDWALTEGWDRGKETTFNHSIPFMETPI